MAPIEKEGYWTPLEKQVRDYIFLPITWPFKFIPHAANILTMIGFGILFYAIYDFYIYESYSRQIWLLTAAWLTDLFDGPIARNNNDVTAFGTAADHIRDYFISFWMLTLAFFITADSPQFWPVYWILVFTILGLLGVIAGTLLFQKEKRGERPWGGYLDFFREFLLKDLVTSVTARIHTVIMAIGGVFYIAGAALGDVYAKTGVVILIIQLFVLGFYNHEIHEARYEDRAHKIRNILQEKIRELEEKLKKHVKVDG
ncbi:MAG: CDP-alcohol phosphatidyltransferase family protein [Candidatus Liptonbacteria bacterium]|nr:CDP-alcohol phosphatidyltransferase family protein [Candidatus Liptonbacteria bacterium]